MTLPLDEPRCSGRYCFDPDGEWCPERMSCERYRDWITEKTYDYKTLYVPCSMAVRDCTDKIEVSEI